MRTMHTVLSKVAKVDKPVSTREWIVGLSGALFCYGFILMAI